MRFALALLFLLLLPAVFSEIDITLPQDTYNIGDSIEISASVSLEQTMDAYMHFSISCGTFSLPYFLTPIETQAGFRTQVAAPHLKIIPSMKGQCIIKAELSDAQGGLIEESLSPSFSVSDGLTIVLIDGNLSTLPATSKKIEGIIRGASDNSMNADITFQFDNLSYATSTFNGKFTIMLPISPTAKSGMHAIDIIADNGENQGTIATEIEVKAVPSHLELQLQPTEQDPGKNITYKVIVTDQAGDLILDAAALSIKKPDKTYLFKGMAQSGEEESYILEQYATPGEHIADASYKNLGAQASFLVNTIRDARISQSEEVVLVENIGNVQYKEEVSFIIEGEKKNYAVKKKVDLKPGQVATIELGREVPSGNYNVVFAQSDEEGTSEIMEKEILAQNVHIEDKRSSLKKVGSGIGSMTGAIIGSDGIMTKNAWYAPLLLVGVIVLIVLYYTRDLWLLMLMRRR